MSVSSVIGALRVTLGLDSAAFTGGLTQAQRELNKAGRSMTKWGDGMKALGGKLSLAITAPAIALGASLIPKALEHASSLGEQAEQLGVTTDALQQYRYAASQSGIEQDMMDASLGRLTRTLGEARMGAKSPVAAFKELGLSMASLEGKGAGEIIPLIAEGLKNIKDPAKQAAILVDLFGKNGQKLLPLLSGGASGVDALTEAAKKLKIVLTPEQIKKADAAADSMGKLKLVLEAKIAIAVVDNLPALMAAFESIVSGVTSVVDWFSQLTPASKSFVTTLALVSVTAGPVVMGLGAIVAGIGLMLPKISTLKTAWELLSKGFAGFRALMTVTVLPALVPLLPAILGISAAVGAVYLVWKNWDKIAAIAQSVWTAVKTYVVDGITNGLAFVGRGVGQIGGAFSAAFTGMIGWASKLYTGIKTWLMDKLNGVWDWIGGKLKWVSDKFYGLYDAVVGHSYIPDMVDEIGQHIARLDGLMVKPIDGMTAAAAEKFKGLTDATAGIFDRLFPKSGEIKRLETELMTLNEAVAAGILPKDGVTRAALDMLTAQISEARAAANAEWAETPLLPGAGVAEAVDAALAQAGRLGEGMAKVGEGMKVGFNEAVDGVIGALQRLQSGIQGGGFLDILSGVLNVLGTVGGLTKNGFNIGPLQFPGSSGTPAIATSSGAGISTSYAAGTSAGKLASAGGSAKLGQQVIVKQTIYQGPGAEEFWGKIGAMDKMAANDGKNAALAVISKSGQRRMG